MTSRPSGALAVDGLIPWTIRLGFRAKLGDIGVIGNLCASMLSGVEGVLFLFLNGRGGAICTEEIEGPFAIGDRTPLYWA
jgi:hypothetical protein